MTSKEQDVQDAQRDEHRVQSATPTGVGCEEAGSPGCTLSVWGDPGLPPGTCVGTKKVARALMRATLVSIRRGSRRATWRPGNDAMRCPALRCGNTRARARSARASNITVTYYVIRMICLSLVIPLRFLCLLLFGYLAGRGNDRAKAPKAQNKGDTHHGCRSECRFRALISTLICLKVT